MLAGLIFATEESEGHGDMLAATLPFGGMTLLEYQARLLIAAGASQLIVAVSRVTPALLGSISRIGRRGVSVDVVRSADEARAKAHPLASVIMVADGLVTTDSVIAAMAAEPTDALLVVGEDGGNAAVERIDAAHHWAGVARLSARYLDEIAAMPREYDFQSTLLRLAVQGGAEQVLLPQSARRAGHGIERHPAGLATRSNAVLAALANQRVGWADRFVFTPITRAALPLLVKRSVPDLALAAGGAVLLVAALALVLTGRMPGIVALPLGVAALSTGSLLSWLRGNERLAGVQERMIDIGVAVVALAVGGMELVTTRHPSSLILAITAIVASVIAARVPVRPRPWHANAALHSLVIAPFGATGWPIIGLAISAVLANLTLAGTIEAIRHKP